MNDSEKSKIIQPFRLKQMLSASSASMVSGTLLALLLAYIQSEVIALNVVISWLFVVLLITLFRAALAIAYQRSPVDDYSISHARMVRFRLGVLIIGAVWGSAGFLMFPANDSQHQMFLIFMLAGLTAGGVVSYSADLVSVICFSVLALVPIIIRLFIEADGMSIAMGMAAMLYLGFMIIVMRHTNRSILENICLRLEAVSREEIVRASEERFRDVSNAAGEYLWEIDANMVYTYVSNRAVDVKGYTPEELLGHTPMDFMPEEDIQPVGEIVNAAIANKAPFKLQHRDITKSGAVMWEEVNGVPFYDKNEAVIGLRGAGLNITDRKQAEVELRIAAAAFETQESIVITDANNVILRVNRSFTESTGFTFEDAVGQTLKLLESSRHNAAFYRAMWETINRTGTWQGEIWNKSKNGEVSPKWLTITAVKGDDGAVVHYVGSYIDISERKAAEEKIQLLAFYDPLTSLPNRRLLMDRLQKALVSSQRLGREGALLFLDLDNFKVLNDTLGHDIGDLLLQQVAQRLLSCVREGDTVARLGGDEFVVVLEALSKDALVAASQTEAIGEKIRNSLNQPYQLVEHEQRSSASIGAVLFSHPKTSMEELMKQADIAMYQAKKAGRNTLRFFDPEMQETVDSHAALESDLRNALVQQQFQLHYQIQVDSSHRPLGAEGLIRWIHPERGFVSPGQFIPLAEETGLILPIGRWVLETACAQLKAWEQDALTCKLTLAVNVSAKQFHQPDFVAQVQAVVQRYAIKPSLLKLELTESMLVDSIEDTVATMSALKEVNIQFSLDDFGTGYSSLQYLKRLPLDQLKIDQSFVHDITVDNNDKAIVKTIIAMAHSMDINVIAEGVETEEQRQFLLDEGCMHYQGYLFGKPMPVAEFEVALKQG